jgi:hypothetical protein
MTRARALSLSRSVTTVVIAQDQTKRRMVGNDEPLRRSLLSPPAWLLCTKVIHSLQQLG